MQLTHKSNIRNLLFYGKSFTTRRAFNLLKLITGFYLSRLTRKPVMAAHPFAISVEPSGHCQLKCPECPTGTAELTRGKGIMDILLFKKLLNESSIYLIYLNLYFQGEPLLHPQIATMVKMAAHRKIFTNISTNGLLLDEPTCKNLTEAGLSRIVISLDGFSQPVYEKYRKGGDVNVVKNGICTLIKARKDSGRTNPHIIVQFLAFEHNMHELEAIKKWCRETGIDKLEIKTAQLNKFGQEIIKPHERKSRYKVTPTGTLKIKGYAFNHCWRQWSSAVITWDGNVAPCCYDKDIKYNLGNISSKTLYEICKNHNSISFKTDILKRRNQIEICGNCPEGRQWLL